MPENSNEASGCDDMPRPYWMPADLDFDSLPQQLQAPILAILNPAYHELVLKARPGVEQSAGITIVHLLWLEILDQVELGQQLAQNELHVEAQEQREQLISRLLRIVGAKNKASSFLLRLQELKHRLGAFSDAPEPFAVPIDESACASTVSI